MTDPMVAYDKAMRAFRKASAAHRVACTKYRMREINDTEFLWARALYNKASAAADAAEALIQKDD